VSATVSWHRFPFVYAMIVEWHFCVQYVGVDGSCSTEKGCLQDLRVGGLAHQLLHATKEM